jgi:hypothetical protein
MRVGRFAKFQYSMIAAFVLMSTWPSRALAQDDHVHGVAAQHQEQTPEQKKQASALVQAVREATRPFLNVENAAPDYALVFGCVSGGDFGARGSAIPARSASSLSSDASARPPNPQKASRMNSRRLRLTGADYLVDAAEWNAKPEHTGPPQLMGQLFHLFDSPNRFS